MEDADVILLDGAEGRSESNSSSIDNTNGDSADCSTSLKHPLSEADKARFSPVVVLTPLKKEDLKKKKSSGKAEVGKRCLRNSTRTKTAISRRSKREEISDIEIVSDESEDDSVKQIDESDDGSVQEIDESSNSDVGKRRSKRNNLSHESVSLNKKGLKMVIRRTSTKEEETKSTGKTGRVGRTSRKAKAVISSDDEDSDFGGSSSRRRKVVKESTPESNDSSDSTSEGSCDVSPKKRKKIGGRPAKKKRVHVSSSGSGDSEESGQEDDDGQKASHRKNIRKMMGRKKLAQSTLDAQAAERERKKRIEQLQKQYNMVGNEAEGSTQSSTESTGRTLVLEKDEETGETLVEVHEDLTQHLKPHQIDGVKFMYMSTIESVKKLDQPPGGCILAHCMGLGKTFQVISFLHTVLSNEKLGFRTALIIAPVNVVLNWKKEFDHWLGDSLSLQIWELNTMKTQNDRLQTVENWQEDGGVMILGYDIFRSLVAGKTVKKESLRKRFLAALLDPGPDFIVCDESHILKNEKTGISQTVNRIKTSRRICLTGTPLQNNLSEYHCMVQFVKPNLLGSKVEFKNRFENPIRNGQCVDSTPQDVRLMKQRAHVLHSLLDACVHRRDYVALTDVLPPRHEYVIKIRLSDKQIELYRTYLSTVVGDTDLESLRARRSLFADFQALQRVWTHPRAMYLHQLEAEEKGDDMQDFIDDKDSSSTSSSSGEENWSDVDDKAKADDVDAVRRPRTRQNPGQAASAVPERVETPLEYRGWWTSLVTEDDHSDINISGKLVILFEILKKCEEIGDKLLVFSQSLMTLAVIEEFLAAVDRGDLRTDDDLCTGSWTCGIDYFRMDGSTTAQVRKKYIESFNDPTNLRARLFLISTKAGSLGTNLVGANRVVIFDASWNPSHDVQAIFRVYRYGQTKPVYIYRFIAQGAMEERIYDRQVTKQSLALRVIDEQQIERHFSAADLEELYKFEPIVLAAKEKQPVLAPPKDLLLRDVMLDKSEWFIAYHEHDSLLQHLVEESLTEEEKEAAWSEYKAEREGRRRLFAPQVPTQSNLIPSALPMDGFFPVIRNMIEAGNRLIRESGENVQMRLEDVYASWLRDDPSLNGNPMAIFSKLQTLIGELERVVQARKETERLRMQQMAAFFAGNHRLPRDLPSIFPPTEKAPK